MPSFRHYQITAGNFAIELETVCDTITATGTGTAIFVPVAGGTHCVLHKTVSRPVALRIVSRLRAQVRTLTFFLCRCHHGGMIRSFIHPDPRRSASSFHSGDNPKSTSFAAVSKPCCCCFLSDLARKLNRSATGMEVCLHTAWYRGSHQPALRSRLRLLTIERYLSWQVIDNITQGDAAVGTVSTGGAVTADDRCCPIEAVTAIH